MNHREPPQLPVGARRALRCLSLLLLPAMTPHKVQSLPNPPGPAGDAPGGGNVPYLPTIGAPPLRFQRAAPPPGLVNRPSPTAPPVPALSPIETSVAQANVAAAQPAPPVPDPVSRHEVRPDPKPAATPAPAKATPPPILPDDTRPSVPPEDFLPFFQIPGAARQPGDVNLIVPAARTAPAPMPLPPSSATYTQTPK